MAAKVLLVLMALAVMCHAGSTNQEKKPDSSKARELVFDAGNNESITMSPQAVFWTTAIFVGLLVLLGFLGVAPLAGLLGIEGTAAPIDFDYDYPTGFGAPAQAYPGEKTTFAVHHALDQAGRKFQ